MSSRQNNTCSYNCTPKSFAQVNSQRESMQVRGFPWYNHLTIPTNISRSCDGARVMAAATERWIRGRREGGLGYDAVV
jgi:hypothetical protein